VNLVRFELTRRRAQSIDEQPLGIGSGAAAQFLLPGRVVHVSFGAILPSEQRDSGRSAPLLEVRMT